MISHQRIQALNFDYFNTMCGATSMALLRINKHESNLFIVDCKKGKITLEDGQLLYVEWHLHL